MGERAADRVCAKLGINAPCRTAEEPIIPDPDEATLARAAKYFPVQGIKLMADRMGDDLGPVLEQAEKAETNPLICECEMVSMAEIECVAKDPSTHSLTDIRLRTRLGMGTCQGTFCSLRTVASLAEHGISLELSPTDNARRFLQERWGGLRPALWGMQAREMELGRAVYAGTLNLDGAAHEQDC